MVSTKGSPVNRNQGEILQLPNLLPTAWTPKAVHRGSVPHPLLPPCALAPADLGFGVGPALPHTGSYPLWSVLGSGPHSGSWGPEPSLSLSLAWRTFPCQRHATLLALQVEDGAGGQGIRVASGS